MEGWRESNRDVELVGLDGAGAEHGALDGELALAAGGGRGGEVMDLVEDLLEGLRLLAREAVQEQSLLVVLEVQVEGWKARAMRGGI